MKLKKLCNKCIAFNGTRTSMHCEECKKEGYAQPLLGMVLSGVCGGQVLQITTKKDYENKYRDLYD